MRTQLQIAARILIAAAFALLCIAPAGCSSQDVNTAVGIAQSVYSAAQSSSSSSSSSASDTDTATSRNPYAYVFRSNKLLLEHYNKHGRSMGFASPQDYEMAASEVATDPDALHKTEKEDGDDVYYLESTNEFVIVSTDGYIRTYFNPDSGIAYFNRQ